MRVTPYAWLIRAIVVASIAHSAPSRAQQLRSQMDVAVLGALPAGSEEVRSNTRAYGLELGGGAGFAEWPASLGVDLRALHWGETTRSLILQIDDYSFPAELTRLEQTVTFSGWLRLHPEVWRFRPYVEAAAGLGALVVKYSLAVQGADAPITVDNHALQLTWGLGGGIDVLLSEGPTTSGEHAKLYATLGLRRTYGGDVTVNADSELGRAHLRLSTDTWVLSAGFTVSICDEC